MDLTIRDWMVIIGVILIVAVGLDAWRRVRGERNSRVRMKLVDAQEESAGSERDPDITWLKELPNGGARVVERGDLIRAAVAAAAAAVSPESVASHGRPGDNAAARHKTIPAAARRHESRPPAEKVESLTGIDTAVDATAPHTLDWLEDMPATGQPVSRSTSRPSAGQLPRAPDPEVFMIKVIARSDQGFRGEDILHILLACDLRFGDMNFFHRHEFEAGRGAIQFSVANMMQPGVFDIDNLADFTTPGLLFFLTLPGPEDMMKAFDYMLETAQAVARNLEGDVFDESRSVLTKQSIEHCRQQIRDLERRLLARAH